MNKGGLKHFSACAIAKEVVCVGFSKTLRVCMTESGVERKRKKVEPLMLFNRTAYTPTLICTVRNKPELTCRTYASERDKVIQEKNNIYLGKCVSA